jgi:glyoxylase-like metal-dependent hydrolase (beta-lactamase superfamily II)
MKIQISFKRKSYLPKLVDEITPHLKLLSAHPTLAGFEDFIGCYLLTGEKKALVDVGPSAGIPGLLNALSRAGASPDEIDYIILTHVHIDHAGGIGQAAKAMKNARVLAHNRALNHLIDPTALWQASRNTLGELALRYGKIEPVPNDRIISVEDGMKVDLGEGLVPEIYLTPGHAPHHLAIFDPKDNILLAGDMAGVYMHDFFRPNSPPLFRLQDFLKSIDRAIALQPTKIAYSHFGCYGDAVQKLRAVRAQTILWHEIIRAGAKDGKTAEEMFRLLRKQDDTIEKIEKLDKSVYPRDYALILNTIRGMMAAE